MDKAEWGHNPVYWWLGLYFCLVCCLDEVSCPVCHCWLGDAGLVFKWVPLWVLTIWYSLAFVLWYSRVLESVFLLQRLRVWSLVRNQDSTSGLLWHSVRLKQISPNKKPKMIPRQMGFAVNKIRQIRIKIMECTHIHPWANQNSPTKKK